MYHWAYFDVSFLLGPIIKKILYFGAERLNKEVKSEELNVTQVRLDLLE